MSWMPRHIAERDAFRSHGRIQSTPAIMDCTTLTPRRRVNVISGISAGEGRIQKSTSRLIRAVAWNAGHDLDFRGKINQ